MKDSFGTKATLTASGRTWRIRRLRALERRGFELARLPYSLRILLENLLRHEDGSTVTSDDVEAMLRWDPRAEPSREIAFTPGRVLLQDFTGVPAVVDLAAMRDAMRRMGGDPGKINPGLPVELVIDHSVQVDAFGSPEALRINAEKEFQRNRERYLFLRWGQQAFSNFKVVPPATGIVHQVNLEYLARVVMASEDSGYAYPDTLVGTDSHTTMINGLGVLGWGVGGIEAEAAMLGQPISMLVPEVVGLRLTGRLPEGATATDLVLRVTELLRKQGVVGKFVEFYGPGLSDLPLADRATVANMAPEYGATCGMFPVDELTLEYLRLSGRSKEHVEFVEMYLREQGLFHSAETPEAEYSGRVELDLASVEPSLAGPKRPQDRVALGQVKGSFRTAFEAMLARGSTPGPKPTAIGRLESEGGQPAVALVEPESENHGVEIEIGGQRTRVRHGSVVIAAITSCTNTSNPSVMLAAGLVAKKAVERGLQVKPFVKTSLAPGSKVVTEYLRESGLLAHLEHLGFHVVGFGCTTCIGNSGPLPDPVAKAIDEGALVVAAVLSGNRNFEGRIHSQVRANYLASPPLVVAYALAGRVDFDPTHEPLGTGKDGRPVYLKEIWPSQREIQEVVQRSIHRSMFERNYQSVFEGSEEWRRLDVPTGATYEWGQASTYVRRPPYFEHFEREPSPLSDIAGARVLAMLGDSVTTDHISPAGSIQKNGPAGKYLIEHGETPEEFNSYGARRGNHEVMVRGTFANVRLKNLLLSGVEGGETLYLPAGLRMSIFDASLRYARDGVPLLVLAGREYGSGSSRDWAAKGPLLLGVRAVIAHSFERIHRSNLVGMGIAPLEFLPGVSRESLGLSGREEYGIRGLAAGAAEGFRATRLIDVEAKPDNAPTIHFQARVRIDTPQEVQYYRHGGILQYVLRKLLAAK